MKMIQLILVGLVCVITSGQNGYSISDEIKQVTLKLEQRHPSEFLDHANHLHFLKRYSDAAFLYNLGYLRYSYYLKSHSEHSEEDVELFEDLQLEYRDINYDILKNVDVAISVYNEVLNWDQEHDYIYYSKSFEPDKHSEIVALFKLTIAEIARNKNLEEYSNKIKFRCAELLSEKQSNDIQSRKFSKTNESIQEIINRLSEHIIDNYRRKEIFEVEYKVREGNPLTIDIYGFGDPDEIDKLLCNFDFKKPFKFPPETIFLFHNSINSPIKYALKYLR